MALNATNSNRLNQAITYLTPASDKPQIIDQNLADILAPLASILGVNQTVFLELLRDRPMLTLLQVLRAVA